MRFKGDVGFHPRCPDLIFQGNWQAEGSMAPSRVGFALRVKLVPHLYHPNDEDLSLGTRSLRITKARGGANVN